MKIEIWEQIQDVIDAGGILTDVGIRYESYTCFKDGKVHREGGPAIAYIDGVLVWMKEGVLTNDEGPAYISENGEKSYYLDGISLQKPMSNYQLPHESGVFGAVRKHDIHTGIDLYASEGESVFSMCLGDICDFGQFTGAAVGSPWWNDTFYVAIKQESKVFLYGELKSLSFRVEIGEPVSSNTLIGNLGTVLKKDKGLPTSMLHLELYEADKYKGPVTWNLNEHKPDGLLDPTPYIKVFNK